MNSYSPNIFHRKNYSPTSIPRKWSLLMSAYSFMDGKESTLTEGRKDWLCTPRNIGGRCEWKHRTSGSLEEYSTSTQEYGTRYTICIFHFYHELYIWCLRIVDHQTKTYLHMKGTLLWSYPHRYSTKEYKNPTQLIYILSNTPHILFPLPASINYPDIFPYEVSFLHDTLNNQHYYPYIADNPLYYIVDYHLITTLIHITSRPPTSHAGS